MEKETIYSEEMEELIPSQVERVMTSLLVVMGMMTSKEKPMMINFSVVKVMT